MDAIILDQTQDTNGELLAKYAHEYADQFPEYVRNQTLTPGCRGESTTAATAYADSRNRNFPCHTKAATWMSTLYFLHNREKMPAEVSLRVGQQLEKFASYWGIEKSVGQLKTAYLHKQQHDLSSLPDDEFAYVWVDENGAKDRRLPMQDTLDVKRAADWFAEYHREFPFNDRATIAEKILHRADTLGAGLGEREVLLQKNAGNGVCNPATVVRQILLRAVAVPDQQMKASLHKLASTISDHPEDALDPEELKKLAITLDGFDRHANLVRKYADGGIKPPEDFLFEVTYGEMAKLASEHCALTTGSIYSRDDFEKLSLSEIRDLFGNDFANEVSEGIRVDGEKLSEIAPTLPLPDAELLDRLMDKSGVQPLAKQAAKQRVGFSPEQWDALAAVMS